MMPALNSGQARQPWLWGPFSAFGLMLAALVVAIDRLTLGGVADFFSLHALGFYWYVFNIADTAIVAGVLGLLYDSFRPSRNNAAKST
jgi:signal peptidase II